MLAEFVSAIISAKKKQNLKDKVGIKSVCFLLPSRSR